MLKKKDNIFDEFLVDTKFHLYFLYHKNKYHNSYGCNIINGYIIKICQILGEVSSPDIYNKIIETTNSLLNKTIDDELNLIFPEVFPILQKIWLNNENNIIKNYNNGNKLMLNL